MKLDPRTIMQFSVIAEESSFTKAAVRLQVAQPWLSARLRKLEDQIGFPLLVRNTRNVTLTDRGAEFLQAARSVAAAVEASEALAVQLRRLDTSSLRLGVGPYGLDVASRRELVDEFAARHRDVRIELDVGWNAYLLERMRSGALDLLFLMGDVKHSDLESMTLCNIGFHLMMSRRNPLAAKSAVTPQDLAGQSVAVFVRRLNPELYDEVFAPLIDAGAVLVQVPELSAGLFSRFDGPEQLIATVLDTADVSVPDTQVARRPLASSKEIAFSLVRKRGIATPASHALWNMALTRRLLSSRM